MDEVVKALADIAARLERIEAAMSARPVTDQGAVKPPVVLTYTPRQLAAKINRSYRWVQERCAAGVIPTTCRRPPWLIPAGAADQMFGTGKTIFDR